MRSIRPVEKVLLDTLADLRRETLAEHPEMHVRKTSLRTIYARGYHDHALFSYLNERDDLIEDRLYWVVLSYALLFLTITLTDTFALVSTSKSTYLEWLKLSVILIVFFVFFESSTLERLWSKVLFGKQMTTLLRPPEGETDKLSVEHKA